MTPNFSPDFKNKLARHIESLPPLTPKRKDLSDKSILTSCLRLSKKEDSIRNFLTLQYPCKSFEKYHLHHLRPKPAHFPSF